MPDGESAIESVDRLNTIINRLTELEDLQLVNKLDIINLKNEIEELKLTTSVPGPEIIQKIKELGKVVENAEDFKKLKGLAKNIDRIIAGVKGASPEGMEDMIRVIDDIDRRVRKLETQGTGMKRKGAGEYAGMIKKMKSGFRGLPSDANDAMGLSSQLEKLRIMVEENAENIMRLSKGGKEAAPGKIRKPPAVKPGIVRCPGCGAGLPPNARFCRSCGARITGSKG